ncbi:hypothetical protein WJX72_003254 [[Myrmecia] bisecta]|uniref:Long-chain-fatty-acid--CoA ligase n=1 Tax=[Myrmecia] bisecta TaxID=41462 RepID=A0AAW1P8I3_9CHLO
MAEFRKIGDVTVALGTGGTTKGGAEKVGPAYRNVVAKEHWPKLEGVTTLYELFERSVTKYFNCKCLGWRPVVNGVAQPFQYMTYQAAQDKIKLVASALGAVGVKAHDKVGMYAGNCPEWMLVLQACNRSTTYCVPLYDSLGEDAIEYIVNHSEASIVFTSSQKFPLLLKAIPTIKKTVKTVVYFGEPADAAKAATEKEGVAVYQFEEFLKLGEATPLEAVPPSPQDPACIMYTSGTTGSPKGVVLTHENIVGAVASMTAYLQQGNISCSSDDSVLSYLTLAHILDRVVEEFALSVGASIGYWQGDVKKLTDDIAALKPTLFIAVPRVLDRVATGVQGKLKKKNAVVQWLFNKAVHSKLTSINTGVPIDKASPLYDKFLFNTVKAGMGGRLRFVVSGGAPLASHVEDYLKVVLCCPVLQGYGLTETCAASFLALPKPGHNGTVGPPVPGTEFRLEGSVELGNDPLAERPRGEICIKGPLVFSGYYKDKQKTDEAFDADGYFHTGDIGELQPNGCLKVVDRLKNLVKLSQGEYVAVEKLEGVFSECSAVSQIWVYGSSYESFLLAVVVPESRDLMAWAKEQGLAADFAEVCKNPKAVQHVQEELTKTGKAARLKGFEMVKSVLLTPEEFSVENDFMTPSFKLKRPQLRKHFQKQLDDLYAAARAAAQ